MRDLRHLALLASAIVAARKKPKGFAITELESLQPVQFPLMNSNLHMGFANSTQNHSGLQAEFFAGSGNKAYCRWQRTLPQFQGFSGIIHGGILVTLADELMANAIVAHKRKFAVSVRSTVQWHRPVSVGKTIFGRSQILASWKNFLYLDAILEGEDQRIVLTASGLFYLPTLSQFKKISGMEVPDELTSYVRSDNGAL